MVKNGKRLVGWAKGKMQRSLSERKARRFEQKQRKKMLKEAYEEEYFKGQLAGAKRVGYQKGIAKSQRGSGLSGFLHNLGDPERNRRAMNVLTRDVPLGLGSMDLRLGSTTKKRRRRKKR